MASGFGFNGGRPRCFAYWQEFTKCYTQTDAPSACNPQIEDYIECLHHAKEHERAKEIKAQFIKKALHQAEESRKASDIIADGVILGVGLINRDPSSGKH